MSAEVVKLICFFAMGAVWAGAADSDAFSRSVYPVFEEAGCRGCHVSDGVASTNAFAVSGAERTGRLVVVDDSNRTCGIGGEVLATAAEQMRLVAPPKRVTRPDGAVLPFARGLDLALQPTRGQLRTAIETVVKTR